MTDETKPLKDKGGRPNKVSPMSVEELAAVVLQPNMGRAQVRAVADVGEHTARAILKATGATIEEFQEIQRIKLQEAADMALEQAKTKIGDASALQAATVYGIFSDKIHRPSNAAQHLHLHIGGRDRKGLLGAILGRHGERVSPDRDSVSTSKGPQAPVIELDLAPTPVSTPQPRAGDS